MIVKPIEGNNTMIIIIIKEILENYVTCEIICVSNTHTYLYTLDVCNQLNTQILL